MRAAGSTENAPFANRCVLKYAGQPDNKNKTIGKIGPDQNQMLHQLVVLCIDI